MLTRAATYGISSAAYLANATAGEAVSNTTICNAYQMPDRFVSQIMRLLVSAGIATSTRGVQGGYKLAKPASKITLLEIVEAIDGPIGVNGAFDFAGLAKDSNASVGKALAAIEAYVRKRLAAFSLADFRTANGGVKQLPSTTLSVRCSDRFRRPKQRA